jgi:hypothetical protein
MDGIGGKSTTGEERLWNGPDLLAHDGDQTLEQQAFVNERHAATRSRRRRIAEGDDWRKRSEGGQIFEKALVHDDYVGRAKTCFFSQTMGVICEGNDRDPMLAFKKVAEALANNSARISNENLNTFVHAWATSRRIAGIVIHCKSEIFAANRPRRAS